VLALLETDFARQLTAFVVKLERFREQDGKRLLDTTVYEDLPFAAQVKANGEWQIRGFDLQMVTKMLAGRGPQAILDIGAWNGWLSHRLAQQGHQVTAIDYFSDPFDGLRAKQFYSSTWAAIQMDLTDLSLLDDSFEVVIINHGLQFFPDPAAHVKAAQQKVLPGGLLVVLGLEFFSNPIPRSQEIAKLQARFHQQHQARLFLKPTKGFLSWDDRTALKRLGVQFKTHTPLQWRNLKARANPALPHFCYGLWHNI
jgi:2-polyprenyl-3-methyl-5-hydroxy-6-metoxy-1,4-benzoquinol methylase